MPLTILLKYFVRPKISVKWLKLDLPANGIDMMCTLQSTWVCHTSGLEVAGKM